VPTEALRIAQPGPSGRDRGVGERQRAAAEDQRLLLQEVADAARASADAFRVAVNHGAAAERDRDQVRHPEVGPDAADLDSVGGLAREAVDQHADVGGGAAHVGDQGIGRAGEEGGAADAVGGAAADREYRIPEGLIEAHQRAVVLREQGRRRQAVRGERVPHGLCHVAGDPGQGPVEYRGVLPLEEPERADLVAERYVHLAELTLDHLGRR
jgi:hypothetical protein